MVWLIDNSFHYKLIITKRIIDNNNKSIQLPSDSPYSFASASLFLEVAGTTCGSDVFKSAVVTCLV